LGWPVHHLAKHEGRDWPCIWRLARLLRREHTTIVHTHNVPAHFHGGLAAVLAGVPVRIHTKHGRDHPNNPAKVRLNHWLATFTDVVVTVSDDAGDVALRIEKVNPRKVRRIWNGIDTEQYRPASGLASDRPPTIATVARLSPEKDQKTMLAAFQRVLDGWPSSGPDPSPRLVVIGDGPCRAELEAEANRLGIAGQVDFLGMRSDVPSLLPRYTLFTLSSVTEGISMTLLEAMACGVPIVATDVGGNREIVQPPTCGLIVPPRDPQALATAYRELLRDPNRRAAMGAAGRQRVVEHFSLETMCRQYAHLYEELLAKKTANRMTLNTRCV